MVAASFKDDLPFAASPPLTHGRLRTVVTARRVRYLTLGYQPIPILSGRKRPALDNWAGIPIDLGAISAWADDRPGELSTGVRTKYTPGFDIDIRDRDVADQVEQALLNMVPSGTILKRIGMPPKRLIPLRCETPFKKVSVMFKAPDDTVHKVEILGDGQQFVAEGVHEDTHQPYYWTDNVGLLSVAHEALPLVDESFARRFVAEAGKIMRSAGWVEIGGNGKDKNPGKTKNSPNRQKSHSSGSSIYGRTALRDECAKLAAMPKDSGRNNALNTAAFNLFQLVAGGGLDENEVHDRLFAAAEANSSPRTARHPCARRSRAEKKPGARSRDKHQTAVISMLVRLLMMTS